MVNTRKNNIKCINIRKCKTTHRWLWGKLETVVQKGHHAQIYTHKYFKWWTGKTEPTEKIQITNPPPPHKVWVSNFSSVKENGIIAGSFRVSLFIDLGFP